MTKKECTRCEKVLDISEFYLCKDGKARGECKPCGRQMCRDYKARNRAKISAYNKTYKADNAEDISVYNHNYNKEHRQEIQERQTRTHKIRREHDQNFVISGNLRSNLRTFIKYQGTRATNIEEFLGCDWYSFYVWLLFMFDNKMAIENYGKYWSIDHVNPCCNFDLTIKENQYTCFHWSNLRPVVHLINQKKTGKIIQEEIDNQNKLVKLFLDCLHDDAKINKCYTIIV